MQNQYKEPKEYNLLEGLSDSKIEEPTIKISVATIQRLVEGVGYTNKEAQLEGLTKIK